MGWPGSPGFLSETVLITVITPPLFEIPEIALLEFASFKVAASLI